MHLLNVLKVESNLDGDNEWTTGHEMLQSLWSHFDLLGKTVTTASAAINDQKSILPKLIKSCARILSKFVSLATSEVKNDKMVCSILHCLNSLLGVLAMHDSSTREEVQRCLIDDQSSVVMLYLQLLTIFESNTVEKHRHRLENERLLESSLQLYHQLLSSLFNVSNNENSLHGSINKKLWSHKLYTSFEGPLASQTVLSLLNTMQHKAKRIATSAASNLLLTLQCFPHHREVWRACYPGTFSGLFVLTQSGYKR